MVKKKPVSIYLPDILEAELRLYPNQSMVVRLALEKYFLQQNVELENKIKLVRAGRHLDNDSKLEFWRRHGYPSIHILDIIKLEKELVF